MLKGRILRQAVDFVGLFRYNNQFLSIEVTLCKIESLHLHCSFSGIQELVELQSKEFSDSPENIGFLIYVRDPEEYSSTEFHLRQLSHYNEFV